MPQAAYQMARRMIGSSWIIVFGRSSRLNVDQTTTTPVTACADAATPLPHIKMVHDVPFNPIDAALSCRTWTMAKYARQIIPTTLRPNETNKSTFNAPRAGSETAIASITLKTMLAMSKAVARLPIIQSCTDCSIGAAVVRKTDERWVYRRRGLCKVMAYR